MPKLFALLMKADQSVLPVLKLIHLVSLCISQHRDVRFVLRSGVNVKCTGVAINTDFLRMMTKPRGYIKKITAPLAIRAS